MGGTFSGSPTCDKDSLASTVHGRCAGAATACAIAVMLTVRCHERSRCLKTQVGVIFAGGVIDSMVVGGIKQSFHARAINRLLGRSGARGNRGPTLLKDSISLWHGHVIPHYAWAGPAYNSRQLDKGDVVVEIDGQAAGDNLTKLLVGSDVAGTPVTLTVKKGGNTGPKKSVTLLRMPSEAIADRRRLFELFTAMKARSTLPRGKETIEGMIDNAIELWTRMTIADGEREAKVRKKVSGAQGAAKKLFVKLKDAADTKKDLYFERHDDALGFRDSVDALIQDLQHAQLEHARVILNLKVC